MNHLRRDSSHIASALRKNLTPARTVRYVHITRLRLGFSYLSSRKITLLNHPGLSITERIPLCYSRHPLVKAATMSMTRSTDPLVWIDCEMTGLDPMTDRILSISCYITSHDLTLMDENGYHAIISTPKPVLDAMGEWCQKTHTATGLVEVCQSPTAITAEKAASDLLSYITQNIATPRVALLAGNSVHADKMFLMRQPWTAVLDHLHYRIFDISAIKEAVRRWCDGEVLRGVPMKKLTHSAEDDIKESIEEARYYMALFKQFSKASQV